MKSLTDHYAALLGLEEGWRVIDVKLGLERQQVVIRLEDDPQVPVSCPECGQSCPRHDHAPERRWSMIMLPSGGGGILTPCSSKPC